MNSSERTLDRRCGFGKEGTEVPHLRYPSNLSNTAALQLQSVYGCDKVLWLLVMEFG